MKTHLPRKHLSQHFLRDQSVINRLIMAIAPRAEDHFVEIGPGQGALTFPLLQSGCRLAVIELDRHLVERFKPNERFEIYQADALKFDFKQLVRNQSLRVVGNLPYHISTPLLFHLLHYASDIQEMTFMLQKEVVDRMAARPATSDYGRLSVMLQFHCQVEKLFDVPPEAFYPPPQVTSSVVRLHPYQVPPVKILNLEHFRQVVAQAFSQRRKTLRNALKGTVDTLEHLGIDPHARAETLSLAEFAELANFMTTKCR